MAGEEGLQGEPRLSGCCTNGGRAGLAAATGGPGVCGGDVGAVRGGAAGVGVGVGAERGGLRAQGFLGGGNALEWRALVVTEPCDSIETYCRAHFKE